MRIVILIAALVLSTLSLGAGAADRSSYSSWRPAAGDRARELPFPRSERAQAVWDSGACWSECGAHCAWGLNACLNRDAQDHCLSLGDACDRYCQRQCRSSGGPLLNITD